MEPIEWLVAAAGAVFGVAITLLALAARKQHPAPPWQTDPQDPGVSPVDPVPGEPGDSTPS